MTLDTRRFRDVLGTFATGVTIITTVVEGRKHGITANSFTSVSLNPPLVLFCLGRHSTNFDAFVAADCFAVNVLADGQSELSTRFAAYDGDRFENVSSTEWVTGAPILDGVISAIDCSCDTRHDAGDHILMVGRARRAEILAEQPPLLFHRGAYSGLA